LTTVSSKGTAATAAVEREVCGLVNELSHALDRHVRSVAANFGLTEAQAVALRELTGPTTLGELSKRMCCEASNATFVADRLEGLGLLERRPHATDRRVKELHLTAEGRALRKRLVKRLTVDSPMQGLDKEQQDLLRDLLLRATTTVPNAG
jgi:DNA-binding MarR family transcriptional regulator